MLSFLYTPPPGVCGCAISKQPVRMRPLKYLHPIPSPRAIGQKRLRLKRSPPVRFELELPIKWMSGRRAATARRPIVPQPTDKPKDIPLLLTISTLVMPPPVPALPAEPECAPVSEEQSSASAQTRPRERRVYQGAVYEKGEDCQWHLLQE